MHLAHSGLATPDTQPSLTLLQELAAEGTAWFPSLIESDVWYGLPLILGTCTLVNIEMMALQGAMKRARMATTTVFLTWA